jgi:hypothetical protein
MASAGDGAGERLTRRRIDPERLKFVEGMYLGGKARSRITSAVCERYGIKARQARHYLTIVEKRLADLPRPSPEATAARVEAMLLEAYELARTGVQRISVSQGAGAGSVVQEFPQPNVGVMTTVAQRLAELHGAFADPKEPRASGAVVIELPASLARPRGE